MPRTLLLCVWVALGCGSGEFSADKIDALGQVLEEPVTIVSDQTTTLAIAIEGDKCVVQR